MYATKNIRIPLSILGVIFYLYTCSTIANEDASPIVVYTAENDFETTLENVKEAIISRGMIISDTLHIQDLLQRTKDDLGFKHTVYRQAVSVEFCNAKLSHQMVQADPSNLVTCPFIISVYVRADDPQTTHIAFKKPHLVGEATKVSEDIFALHDEIIQEALEGW